MQNAILVGLSRQVALAREMDVVANNIANLNTTGYKADGSVFEEYLSSSARADLTGTRVSFVQDRGMWHNMSQGAAEHTGNPLDVAIDGPGFLVVQTPQGDRYTRNGSMQINATGPARHQRRLSGARRRRPDHAAGETTANCRSAATARSACAKEPRPSNSARGKIRLVTFANLQQLQKDGNGTFNPVGGAQPQPAAATSVLFKVRSSSRTCGRRRDVAHDRNHPSLQPDRQPAAAAERLSQSAIDKLAEVPT